MVTYQRDSRQRSVLFVLVFTSLLLITLDSRGNGMVNNFRDIAQNVLAPVRNVVNDAFKPVQDVTGGITNYGSVKDENARLKRQLAALQGKIQRERAVGSQVGELEKLLDLPTIEDATGVAARVVGGSPDNFERTVEINKGTGSGRVRRPAGGGRQRARREDHPGVEHLGDHHAHGRPEHRHRRAARAQQCARHHRRQSG